MKKSRDAEAQFLGMNKFFRLHDYSKIVNVIIATFYFKGKTNILWEDVRNVRDIYEEELNWSESRRLFRKRYLLEGYYDDREKLM